MPFLDLTTDDAAPQAIQLEEVDQKNFRVLTGFRYRDANSTIRITVSDGEGTDLASIPFFLRWFIGTYGKHTRAAILHDHMWRHMTHAPAAGFERKVNGVWTPTTDPMDKLAANAIFRDAMGEPALGVSLLKRWFMWAAVTLDALRTRLPDGIAIYAFVLLHLYLDVRLWIAVFTGHDVFGHDWRVVMPIAFVALAVLWPRKVGAGLLATLALVAFVPPTALVLVVFAVLFLADLGAAFVLRLLDHLPRVDVGPINTPSVDSLRTGLLALPPKQP